MELNDAISSVIKEVCDKKNDIQNAAAREQKTGRDESKK